MARLTIYNEEIAEKICEIIATSNKGLSNICKDDSMPSRSTVHKWLAANKEFANKYARAKEDQADFLAEEIITIADHSDKDTVIIHDKNGNPTRAEDKEWTNRSRLRVDSRKWIASKLKPKKYGDKVEVSGNPDAPLQIITGQIIK